MPDLPAAAAWSAIGTHMIVDLTAEPDVICHGTVYTGSAGSWTDIGRTEEGTFEWAPPPELAALDELPFARLESLSMTVTVPLTRAGMAYALSIAEDELRRATATPADATDAALREHIRGLQDFVRAARAQLARSEGEDE